MDAKTIYQSWLNDPYFDEETRAQLAAIKDDDKEITERFYKELEFGTAGLRGIIGAGINRMNIYTVRKATQGLADYMIAQGRQDKGVAIAYDSRHMSPEFADAAASVLNGNGIKAYVFTSLRPTPELSYAVRYLQAGAGINITASHNPSNYNGYKVYWEDGAQITPPHDSGIMDCVKAITDLHSVKVMEKEEALALGLYLPIDKEIDKAYQKEVIAQVSDPKVILEQKDMSIVYTPLHGTGNLPVRQVLASLGFENVHVVKEQEAPDGDFPTVSYPNPESDEAFELGLRDAKELGAELVLATDPDADRLGVRVLDREGNYHTLTGNMSGALICEYILSRKGQLPADGAVVKSIVSTNLMDAIAKHYNVRLIECLTGFKWIGKQILEFEENGGGTYLFGMEESYGCLPGTYARDKDAVVASVILCEAAAYYKQQNMTLWDVMVSMYERYGYFVDDVVSVTLAGKEGLEKIAEVMKQLRETTPERFGDLAVLEKRDYKRGTITTLADGSVRETGLPGSDVIYYDLEDAAWVCVRPSGTEPKIKIYFGIRADSEKAAADKSKSLSENLNAFMGQYL